MKRNYGLDLFRIMCCAGVLNYHVIDDVLGNGGVHIFCTTELVSVFQGSFYYQDT